jgi:hypothetical protein
LPRRSKCCSPGWPATGANASDFRSEHQFRTPVQNTGSEHQFRTPVQNTSSEHQFRTPVQNCDSEQKKGRGVCDARRA